MLEYPTEFQRVEATGRGGSSKRYHIRHIWPAGIHPGAESEMVVISFPGGPAREKFTGRLEKESAYPGGDRCGPVVALTPPEALGEETI